MRVASIFAWGVGGRTSNNRTDAAQRPTRLTTVNIQSDKQGKRALLPASTVCSLPLGCATTASTAASALVWRHPTQLLSCRLGSATKSLPQPLYPWIWITNTLRTYICEIQLILPPSVRWEEACLSGQLLSAAPGNLSDVGRLRENTRKPGDGFHPPSDKCWGRETPPPTPLWNKSNYRTEVGGRINYDGRAKLQFLQAHAGREECTTCVNIFLIHAVCHKSEYTSNTCANIKLYFFIRQNWQTETVIKL